MPFSFYYLLISQSSTNLAYALYSMTIITFLYQETNSATLASAVTLISLGSQLMSSSTVPLMMEKYTLKNILIISQITQFIFYCLMIISLYFLSSPLNYFMALVLVSCISFFNGWVSPSRNALIPEIVNKEKLINANSLLSTTDQSLLLLGWSFGGVLIVILGHFKVIIITLALLLVSILSLCLLQNNARSIEQKKQGRINALKEGWKIVFHHPTIRTITKMDMIELLGGSIWIGAVTLAFVTDALGQDETWWGYINAAYFAGTIIGGLVIWRIAKTINKSLISSIVLGAIAVAILTMIYSFVTLPFLAILLVLCMGPFYQLRDILQSTFIQQLLDKEKLGKYLAAKATLNHAVFSLSVFLIGILVDIANVRLVYLLSGVLLLCSGIYGYIKLRNR